MKLATRIAWIMLAVSVVAFLVAVGWATLGRALGQEWSSLDGPEPVWPAVVGFSAPYLFAPTAGRPRGTWWHPTRDKA